MGIMQVEYNSKWRANVWIKQIPHLHYKDVGLIEGGKKSYPIRFSILEMSESESDLLKQFCHWINSLKNLVNFFLVSFNVYC